MAAGFHTGAHKRTAPHQRMGRTSFGLQKKAVTANEKPVTWEDWKAQHRWPRLTSIEWALEWLVYWCKGLAFFELLEVVGRVTTVASVTVAVFLWWREADERRKQTQYRAWELINSARGSPGDGGRRDALQDLNRDGVSLAAAPLAEAYLLHVQLPRANLTGATLSGTTMNWSNLIGANLSWANLSWANLSGANLNTANLIEAKLIGANLDGANLNWANLTKADLSGVTVSGTTLVGTALNWANLTRVNLSVATLRNVDLRNAKFCKTIMPDGTVNNRDCPPEPTPPNPSATPPASN